MITLRPYQQRVIDQLYGWWVAHPDISAAPILELPTGAGKSIVIAELVRLLFDTWPEDHPRTVVLVPSKELAEQNAEKLRAMLPARISVGFYSASLGRKDAMADVIVATIGSIYKHAHRLGNIKCVLIDECFTGDTLVSCVSGNKRIDQIAVGEPIHTATGIGIVQAVSKRRAASILTVRFSDGSELRTTDNHPFFTPEGWKRAEDLARGDGVIRLQDMPALWAGFSSVVQANNGRQESVSGPSIVRESAILLDLLLKENRKRDVGAGSERENDSNAQKYSAQTIAAWWERPWNDTTAKGSAFDFERWLDARSCHKNWGAKESKNSSNLLQGGYRQRGAEDSHRTGRAVALRETQETGRQERRDACFAWVESVSREELASPELVFNLQVSGHPSYFAGEVLVHNCHLVNPDGAEAGRYRQFLADLAALCTFRVAGCTATPFRGNGVWLTEGDAPLFTGIAARVAVQELLDAGFLAPLVRPVDEIATRIDVEGVRVTSGDYKLDELDERVSNYLPAAVAETMTLAADRKKWIAFTPTVATANQLSELLTQAGALSAVVTGETPKAERADLIAAFRAGRLRCLVTVVALATGFDVPDVDCILWLRPTKSPVLYVQGAGRGLRIAPGKTDCLWLDFSDTTERLGPVDAIKGRAKKEKVEADAPYRMCPECAAQVRPAAACACPFCGYEFPPPEAPAARNASNAAVMSHQAAPKINAYDVTRVAYSVHKKDGKPDSLKVTYWSGMRVIASEWVCFEHTGFARAKAEAWFIKRRPAGFTAIPGSVAQFFDWHGGGFQLAEPVAIKVDESARYPEVIGYQFPVQEAA